MQSYNRIFVFFAFSIIVSIYAFNVLRDIPVSLFLLGLLFLLFLNYYAYSKSFKEIFIVMIMWFMFGLLLWSHHLQLIESREEIIEAHDNIQEHNIDLEISKIYKNKDFDIEYKAKILKINNIIIKDNVYSILKTKKNFDFKKWDIIRINSKIKKIINFDSSFDYQSYMYSQWIYTIFYSHDFRNIWEKPWNNFSKVLRKTRSYILETIHKLYPKNEAVFLGWILIWARESIPDDMSTSFNNSGLTHLIAVSWYNITIVIVFLSYILSYLPRFIKWFVITFWVVSYIMIVWDSAAVLRAWVMWLIAYYVLMSGRKGDSLAIILLTWIIMLSVNPFLLNYDISFQLSFLAVFWLLYTQWFFEKMFFFLPKKFAIQESFVLTLSAFVFTIPIMLHNFWQISILAPIANMLVAWTIPFAMLFWILSIWFYKFFPVLWYIIWYCEYFLLKWTTSVATFFWGLDFAILKIELGNYWFYFQALYFIIIIFCILFFGKEKKAA